MKKLCAACFLTAMLAACSTPGPVTGRPDRNVSTSGTIGSVKATDGPPPEKIPVPKVPDTARHKRDTTL
ncbi:hypothetical protein Q4E93_24085 [Flavitalea sp. BT771]|uniref:hypothetical protein n=1 Tax=Flavitalea sp. BT771 TaxID=3063329 RepID=UPI0026E2B273|nr:hypothetical protein [Flavitalea sp. BT771]MDO6433706.1 hypothetical protein [Flavitalea sp. BT771]MDV6222389.1 hypothetical protein [Flavitalea sp. BT771]